MNDNFLLRDDGAIRLYREVAGDLPIIDYHNHVSISDVANDKKYSDIFEIWLESDPYKHRLMRICGVSEDFITGEASPREKFRKYCEVFPYLAGNPVYDWSRMELSRIFGIHDAINKENADKIFDTAAEMLASPEFSTRGILSRFNVEYQSPVVTLLEKLDSFDGKSFAPSLRADELLCPSDEFKSALFSKVGMPKSEELSDYVFAVSKILDKFDAAGCRFADHALDSDFFSGECETKVEILKRLGNEYAARDWTLLLHIDANRKTSPRLARIAGPAGGYAAVGGNFDILRLTNLLGDMEMRGGLPDTVIFPLNMSDQAAIAVMQGAFSENGKPSKVQLGASWWWCDHTMGIRNTLNCISSFGAVSQFIGMTTDSRSILSFIRHDYFRRILCSWLSEKNLSEELSISPAVMGKIIKKICYENAKMKIRRNNDENF